MSSSPMRIERSVVIDTGCGSGIGRAVTEVFAAAYAGWIGCGRGSFVSIARP